MALRIPNCDDHDVPPPGPFCSRRGEIPDESTAAALPCRLYGSLRGFRVVAFPKLNPGAVHECVQVADLEGLHAAFVHPQQTALEVKYLDAILDAGHEATLELLGIPPRLFRFFSLRTVLRERHVRSRQGPCANRCVPNLDCDHRNGL